MSNDKELLQVITVSDPSPCCGGEAPLDEEEEGLSPEGLPWLAGGIITPPGPVPVIATRLRFRDVVGSWKVRWGLGRMSYRIPPGIYAVGEPGTNSPVLVTANYKLSFDLLRRELTGLNLWLLVLNTGGINVWCAAGKGTFGTAELVRRIRKVRLEEIVSHRNVILPQLGAPGVSAHEVKRQAGFKVVYGPVRAADIPAFLQNGGKATPEMRQVRFSLTDRLAVTPVELLALLKPALFLLAALLLLNLAGALPGQGSFSLSFLVSRLAADFMPFLGAALTGIVLVPALLPYIPGRAFAWKGWLLGLLWTLAYVFLIATGAGWLQIAAYFLLLPAITAFLAMNFTGSSTYTSLSGVLKEMGLALPIIIVAAALGVAGFIAGYFL